MSFWGSLAKGALNAAKNTASNMQEAQEWAAYASDDELISYAIRSGGDTFKKHAAVAQIKKRGLQDEFMARKR